MKAKNFKQKVFACIMAIIGLATTIFVAIKWWQQGCGAFGIITSIVMYGGMFAVIWACINDLMEEY